MRWLHDDIFISLSITFIVVYYLKNDTSLSYIHYKTKLLFMSLKTFIHPGFTVVYEYNMHITRHA